LKEQDSAKRKEYELKSKLSKEFAVRFSRRVEQYFILVYDEGFDIIFKEQHIR
jgi:hypothetical protein